MSEQIKVYENVFYLSRFYIGVLGLHFVYLKNRNQAKFGGTVFDQFVVDFSQKVEIIHLLLTVF